MTRKIRSLPNKLIRDDGKTILFYLSDFMIGRIKSDGNYFMIALKNDNGNVIKHLGYFEIIEVHKKKKWECGGSGGTHRECVLSRFGV